MRYGTPLLTWILLAGFAATAAAPGRAERFAAWRESLERAATASPAAAEPLYLAVLDEADRLGERGLLPARAADGLGDLLRREERCAEALPFYRRSAEAWRRLFGPRQPRLAVTLHNLGVCLVRAERWEEAEAVLTEASALWRERGNAAPDTARALAAARERRQFPRAVTP